MTTCNSNLIRLFFSRFRSYKQPIRDFKDHLKAFHNSTYMLNLVASTLITNLYILFHLIVNENLVIKHYVHVWIAFTA